MVGNHYPPSNLAPKTPKHIQNQLKILNQAVKCITKIVFIIKNLDKQVDSNADIVKVDTSAW